MCMALGLPVVGRVADIHHSYTIYYGCTNFKDSASRQSIYVG